VFFFNLYGENYALHRGISEFLSFSHSLYVLGEMWSRNLHMMPIFKSGWRGTKDLYVMLLSICEFLEYWVREGRTFIMGLCGITFMWVP
jgi:hypothetical protein